MDERTHPTAPLPEAAHDDRGRERTDADWEAFRTAYAPYARAYLGRDPSMWRDLDTMVWDTLVSVFMEGCVDLDRRGVLESVHTQARKMSAAHKRLVRHEVSFDPIAHEAVAADLEIGLPDARERASERIDQLVG